MKRIVGFIGALFLSLVVFSTIAQDDRNVLREEVEQDAYGNNWFISIGGNANLLFGEQDNYISWTKRIKYGLDFTVGKWFNPDFGARIQVYGGALRGYQDIRPYIEGYYVHREHIHDYEKPMGGDPNPFNEDGSIRATPYTYASGRNGMTGFWQDFNYVSGTFDVLANFTNLMRGHYKERNPIDVIGFAGIGVIHSFDNEISNPSFSHFVIKAGLRINFNISNQIAIFAEGKTSATEEKFDGYSGTALGDGVANAGIGIQFTFNKKFNTLSNAFKVTADEIDRLNKKINENRYIIENHQDILERHQNLLDRLEKCCDENKSKEVVTQLVGNVHLPEYIRFKLDSYRIEASEYRKIADVADYLKVNDNSRLLIIGYADRLTGNPSYNMSLSQRRVEAVASELRRLGISSNRVFIEWKGDREQPFPQNEWNRVVIMVERR